MPVCAGFCQAPVRVAAPWWLGRPHAPTGLTSGLRWHGPLQSEPVAVGLRRRERALRESLSRGGSGLLRPIWPFHLRTRPQPHLTAPACCMRTCKIDTRRYDKRPRGPGRPLPGGGPAPFATQGVLTQPQWRISRLCVSKGAAMIIYIVSALRFVAFIRNSQAALPTDDCRHA